LISRREERAGCRSGTGMEGQRSTRDDRADEVPILAADSSERLLGPCTVRTLVIGKDHDGDEGARASKRRKAWDGDPHGWCAHAGLRTAPPALPFQRTGGGLRGGRGWWCGVRCFTRALRCEGENEEEQRDGYSAPRSEGAFELVHGP